MADKKSELVAWIAPEQANLLKEVLKASKVKLAAIGTTNQSDLPSIGEILKTETCSDLRSLATTALCRLQTV